MTPRRAITRVGGLAGLASLVAAGVVIVAVVQLAGLSRAWLSSALPACACRPKHHEALWGVGGLEAVGDLVVAALAILLAVALSRRHTRLG